MPNRCKKVHRKSKVDPAAKAEFKKSCLDKRSFGCLPEDYKSCMNKYRKKFPPDEQDLKICEKECESSNDIPKCFDKCAADYPLDKIQNPDPCEGVKQPLPSEEMDKFIEGDAVLIRRSCKFEREVPLFRIGEEVYYTENGVTNKFKIIKINEKTDIINSTNFNSKEEKKILYNFRIK